MALRVLRGVGRISRWRQREAVGSRNYQEERDALTIVHAQRVLAPLRSAPPLSRSATLAHLHQHSTKLAMSNPLYIRQLLYEYTEPKLIQLYRFVDSLPIGAYDPYPHPDDPPTPSANQDLVESEIRGLRNKTIQKAEQLERVLPHLDGFQLVVKKSDIPHPNAGFGLFVKGIAPAGTLIALYPGVVYFPFDPLGNGTPFHVAMKHQLDNPYLMARYDNIIIDGRDWHLKAIKIKKTQRGLSEAGVESEGMNHLAKFHNPLAVANFINHPPKGTLPNALMWTYNYRKSFPLHLRKYIPNEFYREPKLIDLENNIVMPGMICFATKEIKDEEVFVDYRLNPKWSDYHPDWYHTSNVEAAALRHKPFRLFYNPF